MGKLLTFLLIVCAASNAVALQCRVCPQGGFCTGGEIGELQSCPTQTIRGVDYVANQCAKFDGDATVTYQGQTTSMSGVSRGCNYLPENFDNPPLKCFRDSAADAYYQGLLASLLQELGTSVVDNIDISISGDLCFCDSDGCNGVDSLQPFLFLTLITTALAHLLLM